MRTVPDLVRLSWRYLWARPLAALLNLLLLTLGLAAITLVLLVATQLDAAFERDLNGIDLVVGAKGSPLQLILAGVFHIDVPTGNIPLQEVQALRNDPLVAQIIPLSMGDSYRGRRIVGTTPDYVAHYHATLAQGRMWQEPMEAVLGASVLRTMADTAPDGAALLGARFIGSHGLGEGGHAHGEHPYRITGVLAPCGCVLDRLILTATESVWRVHEAATADDPGDLEILAQEREVTVALVRYRSPLAAATLPRRINSDTALQAAAPAVEISRLLRLLGLGADVLRAFGGVLLAVAVLSVFIALCNAVRERRADLAMLRMLGAPPRRVAGLLLCEALWLAALACALGLLLGHALAHGLGRVLQAQGLLPVSGLLWLPAEAGLPLLAGALAAFAALLPSVLAYRTDVAELLSQP
ncbi:FtsX-like permease family protein [Verminephrobacter aporrectodeae subsp. tuberculatae]|uniref:FtsX-like permease family protein n=1 Tax=Verminephrobacter aporrectodeae TaxID=1110389 RepID=UPI002243BBD0|nr:FtsX-like permease family protein [Verminephrobacter aporrectodeae]MCW8163908.1 FtsX-like permease family protein [Verminephrobacter aporrectodeae subsp. tuberculatae]MCW8168142.1 FtsX-like permease family protein [Verminephrobacter aporrectodeae subsp. tuberculatae]